MQGIFWLRFLLRNVKEAQAKNINELLGGALWKQLDIGILSINSITHFHTVWWSGSSCRRAMFTCIAAIPHPSIPVQPVQRLLSSTTHHRPDMEQYEFLHTWGLDRKEADTTRWMDKKARKNVFYSCHVCWLGGEEDGKDGVWSGVWIRVSLLFQQFTAHCETTPLRLREHQSAGCSQPQSH